jgi:hypothetical protein
MTKQSLLGKESLAEKMSRIKKEMNTEESTEFIKSPKNIKNKIPPKLFINGRLDRKKHNYMPKSLMLLSKLEEEIKTYCKGGDLAILNYLIKEGIKNVKAADMPINIDIDDIESDIN